jgi:nitrate/nitrite-specific signal transduction histidine kinase
MLGLLLGLILIATFVSVFVTHYILLSTIVDYTSRYGTTPTGRTLIAQSLTPLIIIIPIIFVILSVIIIFISHRIAGPLCRLRQYMKRVGNGDFKTRISFRSYDAVHDIADAFNNMVENLEKRYGSTQTQISDK